MPDTRTALTPDEASRLIGQYLPAGAVRRYEEGSTPHWHWFANRRQWTVKVEQAFVGPHYLSLESPTGSGPGVFDPLVKVGFNFSETGLEQLRAVIAALGAGEAA